MWTGEAGTDFMAAENGYTNMKLYFWLYTNKEILYNNIYKK